ncbi:glycosylphosphatidylinositol anchor biosynthesis [Coemansia sp. RSA 1290]|nr:glycosylphosphatidylinositol anchor biosynthesis [Coemansia sp. RSA 1290]
METRGHTRLRSTHGWSLFAALLVVRIVNALLIQTYIHPDETWQSLEVAHRLAFGYGFVTWEWRHALRGFAHPMLFAAVYRMLWLLGLDNSFLITTAPYLLAAVIGASVDLATFYFARRITGDNAARWALFCSAVSWSMSSGVMRPLVNSAETAFSAAAYAFWPWSGALQTPNLYIALLFAAVACIVRPTSGALWLCAGLVLVARQPRASRALHIIFAASVIGIAAVAAMLGIDYLGYRRWVFPPYQFYQFNVHEGLATWFGESHPLYHLYVSMPILFTSMLPFVLHGVYMAARYRVVSCEPAIVALGASVLFSLVGHMEYRFLYPLLPIGFVYAAVSISSLTNKTKRSSTPTPLPAPRTWSVKRIAMMLLVTNIVPAFYLNLVHQRGVVDVVKHLRQGALSGTVQSVGFLMPCHSTPFYSHLHVNIPMWFLSCEPPLVKSDLESHYWEADDFEQHPAEFIHDIFESNASKRVQHLKPSHLVLYDCMAHRVHSALNELGYKECNRFFNTHFNGDPRRKGDVVVYCQAQ